MTSQAEALRSIAGIDAARRAAWAQVFALRQRVAELERENVALRTGHRLALRLELPDHWQTPMRDRSPRIVDDDGVVLCEGGDYEYQPPYVSLVVVATGDIKYVQLVPGGAEGSESEGLAYDYGWRHGKDEPT